MRHSLKPSVMPRVALGGVSVTHLHLRQIQAWCLPWRNQTVPRALPAEFDSSPDPSTNSALGPVALVLQFDGSVADKDQFSGNWYTTCGQMG